VRSRELESKSEIVRGRESENAVSRETNRERDKQRAREREKVKERDNERTQEKESKRERKQEYRDTPQRQIPSFLFYEGEYQCHNNQCTESLKANSLKCLIGLHYMCVVTDSNV